MARARDRADAVSRAHNHYFKDVSKLDTVDVYRVLELFAVTNPSIAHAIKKLLVAGGRGAGKDVSKDIQEAVDSLERWKEMRVEDNLANPPVTDVPMRSGQVLTWEGKPCMACYDLDLCKRRGFCKKVSEAMR